MKTFHYVLAAAAVVALATGCDKRDSASQNPPSSNSSLSNALAGAKNNSDKTIDVSYLNQALSLYNVQEGRYPATLEELKPKYVSTLPILPPGMKLDYDSTNGTVKIVQQ